MQYAQISDNAFVRQFDQSQLVEWDTNNYCTAAALIADGKADLFGVVELHVVDPPPFNPITQSVARDGAEFVNGQWQYKWAVIDLDPATVAANLAGAKAAKWESIKSLRDKKTQEGGYLAAGKWFHSDTFSRTQQLGLVMMGPSVPDGLQWKTMDGSFVAMTPTLASQIFAAAASQDAAMFGYAEALKAQVDAAADPTVININSGWPATFSG